MSLYETLAHAAAQAFPAVVEHLWQATLFAIFALIVAVLLRRAPARARYFVWLVALVKFVVPSVLLAFAVNEIVLRRAAHLFDVERRPDENLTVVREFAAPVLNPLAALTNNGVAETAVHNGIYALLAFIWLAGATLLLIRSLRRRREFMRAIETGQPLDEGREWRLLQAAKSRLGMSRDIRLVVSAGVREPGVWGAWRRIVIALPETISERLTDAELEAVMLHEIIHVARRDNLISHFQMLVCCLLWFHPLVWLAGRKLLEERERACDEAVMRLTGEGEIYAASILKVLRFCLHSPVAGASGAGGANLRRRLEYIMTDNVNKRLTVWHRLTVGASIAAVIFVSFISGSFDPNRATGQTRVEAAQSNDGRITVRRAVRRPTEASEFDRQLDGQVDADANADISQAMARGESNYGQEAESAMAEVMQSPDEVIRFENGDNAPLTITDARIKRATREQMQRIMHDETRIETFSTLPTVALTNNTSEVITRVAVRLALNGGGGAILERVVRIEPHAAYTFRTAWNELNATLMAAPEEVTARLAAVQFENGASWGRLHTPPLPPAPPSPPSPSSPPAPPTGAQRLRVLHRVEPVYPPAARAVGAEGDVNVEFIVNDQGEVISASAIDGHPLLRSAAVHAMRQCRFEPPTNEMRRTGTVRFSFREY